MLMILSSNTGSPVSIEDWLRKKVDYLVVNKVINLNLLVNENDIKCMI